MFVQATDLMYLLFVYCCTFVMSIHLAHLDVSFGRVRCRLLLLNINDRRDGILSWYGGVSIFATCPVQHMNYCKNQGPSCFHLREHLGTDYTYYTKAAVGFANDVDQQLKGAAKLLSCSEKDKCVIIIMDEMHLRQNLTYDKHTGKLTVLDM